MFINYISALSQQSNRGGWDGMNAALFPALKARVYCHYAGPVQPSVDLVAKSRSKLRRLLSLPGVFHHYSKSRLRAYARLAAHLTSSKADADFFFGCTPWIQHQAVRPYFSFTDACFATYLTHYLEPTDFEARDVGRICADEIQWMGKANTVFFSSRWALDETVREYGMTSENLSVAGLGGGLEPPKAPSFQGGSNFLAVLTDFQRKGGKVVYAAFRETRKVCPEATLTFVGAPPPLDIQQAPGVSFIPYLNKEVVSDRMRLEALYCQAVALVLPTTADASPVVLVEAGYFGCPAIASKRFAIPEMVRDGLTGILLDRPDDAACVAAAMRGLLSSREKQLQMRTAARDYCLREFTWDAVGRRICRKLQENLQASP